MVFQIEVKDGMVSEIADSLREVDPGRLAGPMADREVILEEIIRSVGGRCSYAILKRRKKQWEDDGGVTIPDDIITEGKEE